MVRIPDGLATHLVPVLDFSRDWREAWQVLFRMAATQQLGGLLLRRGRRSDWDWVVAHVRGLGPGAPLLMADFEQGAASQIADYPWLPKAFTVGATNSPDLAYRLGQSVARQARDVGIDMILAPVADLLYSTTHSVIATRSFGATPSRVAEMVAAFVAGCQKEGVKAVVKHFPGHGRSVDDSHQRLAVIDADRAAWWATDAQPFLRAIKAGVEGIMVGHLWSPALDPAHRRPASRSPVVMRGVLRGELNFDGIVITDSLEMGGAGGADLNAVSQAVEAGADLVIGPDLGFSRLPDAPARGDSESAPNTADEAALTREVAENAVAWLGDAVPCTNGAAPRLVRIIPDRNGTPQWGNALLAECQDRPLTSCQPLVVVALSAATAAVDGLQAIESVRATEPGTVVLVACGAIDVAQEASTRVPVILAGDATAASQRAAIRLLYGEIVPRGAPDLPHG